VACAAVRFDRRIDRIGARYRLRDAFGGRDSQAPARATAAAPTRKRRRLAVVEWLLAFDMGFPFARADALGSPGDVQPFRGLACQAPSARAARRTVIRKVVTGVSLECATYASPRAS
jgi:hypothetical protein